MWLSVWSEGWGEKVWDFGIGRYKPLYIGWISNKILIYSTGNYYSQYPVINHNGKEYEKIFMCIIESPCCAAEINIAL